MKRMLRWMSALLLLWTVGCQKTDDLWTEVDHLREQITQLEQEIGSVNEAISALHHLMQESTVVVGITQTEQGYRLELSSGEQVEVILGETLEALVPILGINPEGEWIYSLDNGETFQPLLDGKGNPVKAFAEEQMGATPQLRVDAEGYWEISLDGGAAWSRLLHEGEPINAAGGGEDMKYSSFFDTLTYDEEQSILTIGLRDGNQLTLPVQDTFSLKVLEAEGARFALGETRCFMVESRGVQGAFIEAPDGWALSLEEEQLLVTAPARNEKECGVEVRILITSEEGYLKVVTLHFTLLTVALDEQACTAWNNFKLKNEQNLLLDFSYAGYQHGEQAPKPAEAWGYKTYNVVDYGADPTGQTSSREALITLLTELRLTGKNSSGSNQANASANAIIYFPEGTFILHSNADNTKNESADYKNQIYFDELGNNCSEEIFIRGGNFILRGAGRDKTTLVMQDPNLPSNAAQMWSSPVMINIKHNSGPSKLTDVTADAPLGGFSVEVTSTAGLSTGDWVLLKLACNDSELVAQELAPHTVDKAAMTDIQTIKINDYHQIKSISGNTITFHEPLMHAVEAKWGWEIHKYPHYENVGVEDLAFKGYSKADFIHHGSWEDDGAYKPLNMMRLTNSWLRRVDFHDVSEANSFASCANCSAYDVKIDGLRGHSAIRSQASSRIFIGKVVDESRGKTVTPPAQGVSEIADAGQYHASGVSETSLGAVLWNNTWGEDAMFESHSRQPRATLVDNCHGGFVQWRFGGDEASVPNHLENLTIWNFEAKKVKHDMGSEWSWWLSSDNWWKVMPPIVVGFHGEPITFNPSPEQIRYEESNGVAVWPESLYEAQLRERLGYVPAWLNMLK